MRASVCAIPAQGNTDQAYWSWGYRCTAFSNVSKKSRIDFVGGIWSTQCSWIIQLQETVDHSRELFPEDTAVRFIAAELY